jgi:type IV pilus assembly protein PilV
LLEVLVAIVVLSFGVLGVVGLQAAALQANKDARYQSTAIAMGRELADLMRGNKDLAIQNSASNPYLGNWAPSASGPTGGNCFTGACASTAAVANHNMREWLLRVQAALPNVRVTTCFDATPYATGLPQWGCSGTGGVAVVKMGWTRQSYDRSASSPDRVTDTGSRPVVILPLIAGSVE